MTTARLSTVHIVVGMATYTAVATDPGLRTVHAGLHRERQQMSQKMF